MTDKLALLSSNAKGWLSHASLAEVATLLDAIEDCLIERHCPAASLVSQARVMVERQAGGA